MKHRTYSNEKLLQILSERKDIMSTFIDLEDLDDEQLAKYNAFLKWYDSLTQLDKDLYFLFSTGHSCKEIAQLFDISISWVYAKRKILL